MQKINSLTARALAALSAAALAACGGGGGGSTTPPPVQPTSCQAVVVTHEACSFNAPALAHGASSSLTTVTAGYTGAATAVCTEGRVSLTTSAQSCVRTGPSDADLALQTSIPPLTYDAGSGERAMLDFVNRQRQQCGFGLLAQNDKLDRSARAHGNYVLATLLEDTMTAYTAYVAAPHIEIASRTSFTGITVRDRATAAAYSNPSSVTESLTHGTYSADPDGTTVSSQGAGLVAGKQLLGTAYHMRDLMGEYREAGVGTSYANPGSPWAVLNGKRGAAFAVNMTLGFATHPQRASALRSYPCEGATDVEWEFQSAGESPNPLAGMGLPAANGQPIYFKAPVGTNSLQVESIRIAAIGGLAGATVFGSQERNVTVLTQATDQHRRLAANEVFVIPHTPLQPSTRYEVTGTLLLSGSPQSVRFVFETGAGRGAITSDSRYRTPAL